MMDKMKIDWEYCYGIKSLKHEFSFSEGKHSHLIYAPNGTMKTSFAKTMKYLSGQTKEKPCDQLCEANKAKYRLTTDEKDISRLENGADLLLMSENQAWRAFAEMDWLGNSSKY